MNDKILIDFEISSPCEKRRKSHEKNQWRLQGSNLRDNIWACRGITLLSPISVYTYYGHAWPDSVYVIMLYLVCYS